VRLFGALLLRALDSSRPSSALLPWLLIAPKLRLRRLAQARTRDRPAARQSQQSTQSARARVHRLAVVVEIRASASVCCLVTCFPSAGSKCPCSSRCRSAFSSSRESSPIRIEKVRSQLFVEAGFTSSAVAAP
jgi:hypothetical protein